MDIPDTLLSQRVLVGDSVYENAQVTIREDVIYIEFEAEDLDNIMLDLSDA